MKEKLIPSKTMIPSHYMRNLRALCQTQSTLEQVFEIRTSLILTTSNVNFVKMSPILIPKSPTLFALPSLTLFPLSLEMTFLRHGVKSDNLEIFPYSPPILQIFLSPFPNYAWWGKIRDTHVSFILKRDLKSSRNTSVENPLIFAGNINMKMCSIWSWRLYGKDM